MEGTAWACPPQGLGKSPWRGCWTPTLKEEEGSPGSMGRGGPRREAWTCVGLGSQGIRQPRSSLVGTRHQACTSGLFAPPSLTGRAGGWVCLACASHFSAPPPRSILRTLLCSGHTSHPGFPLCSSPVLSSGKETDVWGQAGGSGLA